MASFSFWTSDVGKDYAQFKGSFSGGDGNYGGYRVARLKIDGTTYDIYSSNMGTSSSSFSFKLTGLAQGTLYNWSVTLGYLNGNIPVMTSHSDSGSFTTEREVIAEFSVDYDNVTYNSVDFSAEFTGGDAGYSGYRYIRITLNGKTQDFRSRNRGGADSYFDFTITGLPSDTSLYWHAVLCYGGPDQIRETDYSASGLLRTAKAPGYEIYIGNGRVWECYTAHIGNGRAWEAYGPKIGDGQVWQPK